MYEKVNSKIEAPFNVHPGLSLGFSNAECLFPTAC